MPKYAVTFYVKASTVITVNANNQKEAAEKAAEVIGNPPMLCPHCTPKINVGDLTGEIEVELVQ